MVTKMGTLTEAPRHPKQTRSTWSDRTHFDAAPMRRSSNRLPCFANIPRLPKGPLDVLLQPLQCLVCLDHGRPGRPSLLFVKTPQPRLPREVHHFTDFTEEAPTV